ncbi:MAG: hypothetical protein COA53_12580 [Rhodobacteraceae bacterium]|nr:MAG: hypothetical protein COA53_12580 [Paracoccaceae bacterium]
MSEPTPMNNEIPEPANLRFLRRLVTVLTATMILGLLTIVALFVIKFMGPVTARLTLPAEISLPAGETAQAITQGTSWIGVVTTDESGVERIHILNLDGTPRQIVNIAP